MSDDRAYHDGDIVWVKLGSYWWPGEVTGTQRQPEGLLKHLKRKPYCVVKFFQEDAYEYVKNAKQVFPFQCDMKQEFISKGLSLYNAKKKFMEKFPADVEMAERLTRDSTPTRHSGGSGDTLFINDRPDSIVKAILSQGLTPCHSPLRGRRSGDSVTKILNITPSRLSSTPYSASTSNATTATSSINVSSNNKSLNEHAPWPGSATPSSNSTPKASGRAIVSPSRDSGVYRCHLCDFTSLRQTVIIYHRKSHLSSNGATPNNKNALNATRSQQVPVATARVAATTPVTMKHSAAAVTVFDTPTSVDETVTGQRRKLRQLHAVAADDDIVAVAATPTTTANTAAHTKSSEEVAANSSKTIPVTTQSLPSPNSGNSSASNSSSSSVARVMINRLPMKELPAAKQSTLRTTTQQLDNDLAEITLPPTPIRSASATLRNNKRAMESEPTTASMALAAAAATVVRPQSTTLPKRNTEEIRQSLLADWSDDEDKDVQIEGDGTHLEVAPIADLNSNAAAMGNVSAGAATTAVAASFALSGDNVDVAATIAGKSKRIRNIPKKDRRDIVLREFNNDNDEQQQEVHVRNSSTASSSTMSFSSGGGGIAATDTPPIINLDSSASSTSSDSVVVVEELTATSAAAAVATDVAQPSDGEMVTAAAVEDKNVEKPCVTQKQLQDLAGNSDKPTAAISCFDFEEEDEDNGADILTTIANFKKQYYASASPEKPAPATAAAPASEQRNGIGTAAAALRNKNDEQLSTEIETLLSQTSSGVGDSTVDEAAVKALPIKERGKRIFKSRNRSPVELNAAVSAAGIGTVDVVGDKMEFDGPSTAKNDEVTTTHGSDADVDSTADGVKIMPNTNGEHDQGNNGANGELEEADAEMEALAVATAANVESNAMTEKVNEQEDTVVEIVEDEEAHIPLIRHTPVELYRRMSNELSPVNATTNAEDDDAQCKAKTAEVSNTAEQPAGDDAVTSVTAAAAGAESGHSRFNSPMDENSSAGAEFGSPTSMLDDERLPLANEVAIVSAAKTEVTAPAPVSPSSNVESNDTELADSHVAVVEASLAPDSVSIEDIESSGGAKEADAIEAHKPLDDESSEMISAEKNDEVDKVSEHANEEHTTTTSSITLAETEKTKEKVTSLCTDDVVADTTTVQPPQSALVTVEQSMAGKQEGSTPITQLVPAECEAVAATSPNVSTPDGNSSPSIGETLSDERSVMTKRKRRSCVKVTPRRSELGRNASSPVAPSDANSSTNRKMARLELPKGVEEGERERTTNELQQSAVATLAREEPAIKVPIEQPNPAVAPSTELQPNKALIVNEKMETVAVTSVGDSAGTTNTSTSSAANTPSLMPEKVRINVDVAHPLSSQIADILALTASNSASPQQQQQELTIPSTPPNTASPTPSGHKRKSSFETDIPSFVIDRAAKQPRSQRTSSSSSSTTSTLTPTPPSKEELVFDINSMPILLSNEPTPSGDGPVQYVLADAAVADEVPPKQRSPRVTKTNSTLSRRANRAAAVESATAKQIGTDSLGNKYVIIKTPPIDATTVATTTFSIGSNVTVRAIGGAEATTKSPSPTKPKSPAAAATGGRKHAGNTITLPSSSPSSSAGKAQQAPANETSTSHRHTAQQRRLTQTETPFVTIKPTVGDQRRRLSATHDVATNVSNNPSTKMSKSSLSGENFATAQQQLLQLKQQQREVTASGSATIEHRLHNRKPRKQPQQHRSGNATHQQQQQQQGPSHKKQQASDTLSGGVTVGIGSNNDNLVSQGTSQTSRNRQQQRQQQQQQQQHQQKQQQQQHQQNLIQHQQIIVPAPVEEQQQQQEPPVHSTTISEEQLLQIQSEEQIDGTSNILAVPTQPIPGYNETFLLCTLVNNTYKPIDNVPLYLDHDLNQLVPVPLEALDGQPHLIVQQPPATDETQQQQQQQQAHEQQIPKVDELKATVEPADSSTQRQQQLICVPGPDVAAVAAAKQVLQSSLVATTTTSAALPITTAQMLVEGETAIAIATTTPTTTLATSSAVTDTATPPVTTIVTDTDVDSATQMAVFMPSNDANAAEIVADNAVILNIEGQQIILDAATFAHLLANPDANTQLITDDGTEFVLTREVLAALEAQQEIVAAGTPGDGSVAATTIDGQAVDANTTDILAVALAGSDLYGSEVLEIETSQGIQLMSTDGTLMFHPATLPQPHLTPPITAQTSETNALLNQTPIMSTLEKPSAASAAAVAHKRKIGDGSAGAVLNNLTDSLAVIGVSAQTSSMPASLELPITVTNPAIAPKLSNAVSAAATNITGTSTELELVQYQASRTIAAAIAQEGRLYGDPGS